jgi:hypothetical protein
MFALGVRRGKAALFQWVQVPPGHRSSGSNQGKTHNQAIRALGRHLCRVIFKLLSQDRPYRIDP